jgi:hypothetical protein
MHTGDRRGDLFIPYTRVKEMTYFYKLCVFPAVTEKMMLRAPGNRGLSGTSMDFLPHAEPLLVMLNS